MEKSVAFLAALLLLVFAGPLCFAERELEVSSTFAPIDEVELIPSSGCAIPDFPDFSGCNPDFSGCANWGPGEWKWKIPLIIFIGIVIFAAISAELD